MTDRSVALSRISRTASRRVAAKQTWLYQASSLTTLAIGALLGGAIAALTPGWAAIALGVAVVVGLVLASVNRWVRTTNGTLYYVSILSQEMGDQHRASYEVLKHSYGKRWPIPVKSNPRLSVGDVDDLTDQVNAATQRMTDLVERDDQSTGYHVAMNMLFPTALAFGFDVDWPVTTDFIELPTDLTMSGPADPHLVQWRRGQLTTHHGLAEPTVRVSTPPTDQPVRSVLLTAELTSGGGASSIPWRTDLRYRVACYLDPHGSDDDAAVRPVEVDTDHVAGAKRARDRAPKTDLDLLAVVHPEAAARVCVHALRDALHHYPDALLFVVLRVPKAVGVRIGDLLEGDGKTPGDPGCGHDGCKNASCNAPWSTLIPLVRLPDGTFRVARVHDSQPTATAIHKAIAPLR